jgi:hypothetical protein
MPFASLPYLSDLAKDINTVFKNSRQSEHTWLILDFRLNDFISLPHSINIGLS